MNVKLKNGSIVDVQRMSDTERSIVINDLESQVKVIQAKFQAIHVDEVVQISKLREKIAAQKEKMRTDMASIERTRRDVIALNKDVRRKHAGNIDRVLLDVIKEHVSQDDFMRFVAIAEQRVKEFEANVSSK
jgi:hypothetical protein